MPSLRLVEASAEAPFARSYSEQAYPEEELRPPLLASYGSYATANLPHRLYDNGEERLFFDHAAQPALQRNSPFSRQAAGPDAYPPQAAPNSYTHPGVPSPAMDPTSIKQKTWTSHRVSDFNTKLYERAIVNGAEEPYNKRDRLRSFATMLGTHVAGKSDRYTRPLKREQA